jgi:hypothetical protein
MPLNGNWCKLKHAQTHLYYDQIAGLPLSRAIKLFRERHSQNMYVEFCERFPGLETLGEGKHIQGGVTANITMIARRMKLTKSIKLRHTFNFGHNVGNAIPEVP